MIVNFDEKEKIKCEHEWVDHWDAKYPEVICINCGEKHPKNINL